MDGACIVHQGGFTCGLLAPDTHTPSTAHVQAGACVCSHCGSARLPAQRLARTRGQVHIALRQHAGSILAQGGSECGSCQAAILGPTQQ